MEKKIYIGTAAWNIPKMFSHLFGTAAVYPILKRYASVLNAVEINSSFYKDHLPKTYARWSNLVPENFRFSVKLSRVFTHEQKLQVEKNDVRDSLSAIQELGAKWGVLLIQLPPKLQFNEKIVRRFFENIRSVYSGHIALEPRHQTWTDRSAVQVLQDFQLSKVCADPERCEIADEYCGWQNLKYYRLHGTPEIYKSNYQKERLNLISQDIQKCNSETWCIFDNTTFGFASENAIMLQKLIH